FCTQRTAYRVPLLHRGPPPSAPHPSPVSRRVPQACPTPSLFMLRRIHDPERGASLTQYADAVVRVASVIAAVMGIGIPDRVSTMLDHAFGTLENPGAVSADGSSDASNGGSDPAGDRTADEDSSAGGWNAD